MDLSLRLCNPPKPTKKHVTKKKRGAPKISRHHPLHQEIRLKGPNCANGEQESSQPSDKEAVDGGKNWAKNVDPQREGNDDEVEDQEQQIPSHDDVPGS